MRNTAITILGTSAIAMLLIVAPTPNAYAAGGKFISKKVCKAKPTDVVTQGGCIVANRKKGNCWACHMIKGAPVSETPTIAPMLVSIKQRFPDKAKLREQVANPHKVNPDSVMPPFEKHGILSKGEIDKVVEYLYTL